MSKIYKIWFKIGWNQRKRDGKKKEKAWEKWYRPTL